MAGISDLDELLASLQPTVLPGEDVFVGVDDAPVGGLAHAALVRESSPGRAKV